jgi:hypothetical protein
MHCGRITRTGLPTWHVLIGWDLPVLTWHVLIGWALSAMTMSWMDFVRYWITLRTGARVQKTWKETYVYASKLMAMAINIINKGWWALVTYMLRDVVVMLRDVGSYACCTGCRRPVITRRLLTPCLWPISGDSGQLGV